MRAILSRTQCVNLLASLIFESNFQIKFSDWWQRHVSLSKFLWNECLSTIMMISQQCRRKTFMVHQTFVWWALYIPYKFVKSPIRHLGLAIGNVRRVRRFSPSLSQLWFRYSNGLVLSSQQVIIWANGDLDLCHHMASLGHNELMSRSMSRNQWVSARKT